MIAVTIWCHLLNEEGKIASWSRVELCTDSTVAVVLVTSLHWIQRASGH